ncbi:P2X purinoceptor 7 [Xenopus laevis]|uniref:P2X purinoceptor 7 n=2 Tax=Xenopus laevis TaxID=8355 RepID=A0A1L8EZL8_XENLA|nr:P2X purinoceptor 7 [Xenopus laevis]OCT64719.1 hypothetical protein XELAEV_18045816mg [Xenopus laevis]
MAESLPQIEEGVPDDMEQALITELERSLGNSVHDLCFQNDPEWSESELTAIENTPQDIRIGNTFWCNCAKCLEMPTRDESCCCTEMPNLQQYLTEDITCITLVQEMLFFCTNEDFLDFMIRWSGRYTMAQYNRDRKRILRKASYRAFTTWAHGHLGPGNRIPIPSCIVNMVRNKFPDDNQRYTGFYWSNDYPAIDMAYDG